MEGHDHGAGLLAALPGADLATLVATLLLAGLFGGLTHCAGMCGPFVLGQVGARLEAQPAGSFGGWARLRGAALVPYHLGRLTTYTLLGAVAGAAGGVIVRTTEFRWLLGSLLALAALLFASQAIGWRGRRAFGRLGDALSRVARPLVGDPRGWRGYALGVALGFLPCGLLYGALAAAAGSGSAAVGAAGMVAFVLGTMPSLVAVGWGGALLGARRRDLLRRFTRPLLAINALVLAALAVRAVV